MKKYGVLDIGSNTVVLVIYEFEDNRPKIIFHKSSPVHLVQYEKEGYLNDEGLSRLSNALDTYQQILTQQQIDDYAAFITEPWRRIDNVSALEQVFKDRQIPVYLLSGEQEALLDYMGSKLDYPDITSGKAFDIGGGSTELISFHDDHICAAVSLPLGCVRLADLDVHTPETRKLLEDYGDAVPALFDGAQTIIGIGGTVRAMGLLYTHLYGETKRYQKQKIQAIFDQLCDNDPDTIDAMKQTVSKGRQEVFIYGLHMLLDILDFWNAEEMRISTGCVREGFLFEYLAK